MVQKYIIDKADIHDLITGKELQPRRGARAFCVEISGKLTNGDVIRSIFPDIEVEPVKLGDQIVGYDIWKLDNGTCAETYFTKTWWNAPYKAESEDK